VDYTIDQLREAVERLRSANPLWKNENMPGMAKSE